MQLKNLAAVMLFGVSAGAAANPIMDFEFNLSNWEQPGDWQYSANGDNSKCNFSVTGGKLCSNKNVMFLYFNGANNDHIGWMRYGYMQPDAVHGFSGSGLSLRFTGGAKSDGNGGVLTQGAPIYDIDDYELAMNTDPSGVFATDLMPESPTLYYKAIDTNASTLGIFPLANRFVMQTLYDREPSPYKRYSRALDRNVSAPEKTLAWYPFIDSGKGAHYYHHATNRRYGGWMTSQFDAHPTHKNTGSVPLNGGFKEGGESAPLDGVDYFRRIATFAVRYHGLANSASPSSVVTDEWRSDYVQYENEETIANLSIAYDPDRGNFNVSFEDKYRCLTCNATYEVRYSFSPINYGNWAQATPLEKVENFFIEDDKADKLIRKPNPGYNQLWAYLVMPYADAMRFREGEAIYFAVKDVSNRQFSYDSADDLLMDTPWGQVKKRDLPKTIKVDSAYHLQSGSLEKDTPAPLTNRGIGITIDQEMSGTVQFGGIFTLMHETAFADGFFEMFPQVPPAGIPPYCGVDISCTSHPLLNADGEAELNGFGAISHEIASRPWENVNGLPLSAPKTYDVLRFKGNGRSIKATDTLAITLKNPLNTGLNNITPRATAFIEGRPSLNPDHLRYYLRTKHLMAGQSIQWLVPLRELAGEQLNDIAIHLQQRSDRPEIASVALLSQDAISGFSDGESLVNFFADGEQHSFSQVDWQSLNYDGGTGKVNNGIGAVNARLGDYQYISLTGSTPLVPTYSTLRLQWQNNTNKVLTIAPKYSFDDTDAPNSGITGTWSVSDPMQLQPNEVYEQQLTIPTETLSFGVSFNTNNAAEFSLNRIMLQN